MWYRHNRQTKGVALLLCVSVILMITWSYFAEIEQVVRAEGRVVPSGQNKLVQHLEGGIISEILIDEGDIVEPGELLFRIKNAYLVAELNSLEIDRQAQLARKHRLLTQLSDRKEIKFPEWLKETSPDTVKMENRLLQDEVYDFEKQQQILRSQLNQKEFKIKELESQKENLKIELELATRELELNKKLQRSGAASERDILNSQKRYQSLKTSVDKVSFAIPVARSEVREVQSLTEKSKSNYILHLREVLNETETRISKILSQKKAKQDQQERSAILSSVKGVVNKLYINTIGGIIRSGDVLASITPLETSLIIEAKVKEADRGNIWIGQPAKVKLRAYDFASFGSLEGKISLISPDSFTDERRPGLYYYQITIAIENILNKDSPVLPGMISDVDLLSGKKSVFSILTGPILKTWSRALTEG